MPGTVSLLGGSKWRQRRRQELASQNASRDGPPAGFRHAEVCRYEEVKNRDIPSGRSPFDLFRKWVAAVFASVHSRTGRRRETRRRATVRSWYKASAVPQQNNSNVRQYPMVVLRYIRQMRDTRNRRDRQQFNNSVRPPSPMGILHPSERK